MKLNHPNSELLAKAAFNSMKSMKDFSKAVKLAKRSRIERAIDAISNFLFGNKSCMPNELKSFR